MIQQSPTEERARLKALSDRATPGPWSWEQCGEKEDVPVIGIAFAGDDPDCEAPYEGEFRDSDANRMTIAYDWQSCDGCSPSANAAFAVAAVNYVRRLLAPQAAQPAEADGWVMVPREPTEAMLRAAIDGDAAPLLSFGEDDTDVAAVWSAMIASTPKAPTSTAGEVDDIGKGNHDCLAKRRPGEPMFILLGRDPDAWQIVRMWATRRLNAGGDPEHCTQGLRTANAMREYAADPANRPASAPEPEAYAALATPPAPNDDLRAALARIRTSMALLQQNSEGCALNHYGADADIHGLPGWLVDTKADLDKLTTIAATLKENRRG